MIRTWPIRFVAALFLLTQISTTVQADRADLRNIGPVVIQIDDENAKACWSNRDAALTFVNALLNGRGFRTLDAPPSIDHAVLRITLVSMTGTTGQDCSGIIKVELNKIANVGGGLTDAAPLLFEAGEISGTDRTLRKEFETMLRALISAMLD